MDSKTQKIVLAAIVVVAVVLGLIGGRMYVMHRNSQIVTVPTTDNEQSLTGSEAPQFDFSNILTPTPNPNDGAGNSGVADGEELTEMPDDGEVLEEMPDDEVSLDEEGQSVDLSKLTPEQRQQEIQKFLHREHLKFYRQLMQNPAELGFRPGEALFQDVYKAIRSSYVDNVSDEKLYAGVMKELGVLFEAAGIPVEELQKVSSERSALEQLDELFGGKIDSRILGYAAIQGMFVGLDDPYSVLMTPKEYGQLQEQVQSKGFGGVGIYIEVDKENNNQVTIFEPLEDTPAEKAGLEAGDQLLSIDGVSTKGMALDVAMGKIRGPVGSTVVLEVRRKGLEKPFTVTVKRAMIHMVSTSLKMLQDKIAYIRVRQFGSLTAEEFDKEWQKAQASGAKGLILDLRNNGGGYVDAAVKLVGRFVSKGSLVVYTEGRTEKRQNYRSSAQPTVKVPVVVLINRFSASASEITAGALRDSKIAKLVGEKSFGKGSVQQLFNNNDGSAFKLTVAHFFSPSGHKIDHEGMKPDVELEMEARYVGRGEKDVQLQRALRSLTGK